jgi:hypothetical protein
MSIEEIVIKIEEAANNQATSANNGNSVMVMKWRKAIIINGINGNVAAKEIMA